MIFSSRATLQRHAAVAAISLTLLAACGGGTTQYEAFVPQRLLAFGDENSAITATGRSYSVNGLDATGQFDCSVQPNWVQQLGGIYGFVFAECNPTAVGTPQGRMLARAGARVDDVAAQVEAQVAAGGFRANDMATVLAGANDIIDLYNQSSAVGQQVVLDQARARGRQLAQVVNRLVGLGVKVIVSDLYDMGLTPFANAQNQFAGNGGPSDLLSRLTTAFNEQLGVNIILDGRFVGLVQAQLRFQAVSRAPPAFNIIDASNAICTVAPPDCTTGTLITDAQAGASLWSNDTYLAPGGQVQLATLAVDRARRNPF